jgi:O-antigen ligase
LGAYYVFIFSIPFQTANVFLSGVGSISRLTGYLFVMITAVKPRLCYKRPSRAFWFFGIYLVVFVYSGLFATGTSWVSYNWIYTLTLIQLLLLFWVSSSLLRHNSRVIRQTLWTFASACVLLAVSMVVGLTSELAVQDRETALDANPNSIAMVLMLGLLAQVGLAYGREETSRTARTCFWLFSPFLFLGLIRTGSRGAIVALLAGLLVFPIKRANVVARVRLALVMVLLLAFVAITSQSIGSVSDRWRRTFAEGDTAGRDEIFSLGWGMFLEKPVLGWGPVSHQAVLGSRLGSRFGLGGPRDFHNLYLHILTEVGLAGAVPFFLAILICWRSAWRARNNIQGILPMAMVLSLLVVSMVLTTMDNKLLWLVFAYASASGTYPPLAVRSRQRSPLVSNFRAQTLAIATSQKP